MPFFLLRSVPVVLMPAVAAAYAATKESRAAQVGREIQSGVGDSIVLLALPTALLITLGDRALDIIFGSQYAVDGLVVAPLAIATAAITLFSVFVAVETAFGTLRLAAGIGLVGSLLIAAAAALGGQGSDVSRAAWAVALAATVVVLVHGALLWARTGRLVPGRALYAALLAAAIGAVTLATPERHGVVPGRRVPRERRLHRRRVAREPREAALVAPEISQVTADERGHAVDLRRELVMQLAREGLGDVGARRGLASSRRRRASRASRTASGRAP